MWQRCMAGACRLESPTEKNACFPLATEGFNTDILMCQFRLPKLSLCTKMIEINVYNITKKSQLMATLFTPKLLTEVNNKTKIWKNEEKH